MGNMAVRQKALNIYRHSRIETASPAELVLTLLNASLSSMKKAKTCIAAKDYVGANAELLRAQDIVDELRGALDFRIGKLAEQLGAFYSFIYLQLIQANISKETEPLDNAFKVMIQIRDIWKETIKSHG